MQDGLILCIECNDYKAGILCDGCAPSFHMQDSICIKECSSNSDCLNGGICTNKMCECVNGFGKPFCEDCSLSFILINNICEPLCEQPDHLCFNGVCSHTTGYCECFQSFDGELCEVYHCS